MGTTIEPLEKTREKLNRVSPSFCMAKWNQTTIHLYNGNTQSCHHVKSHRVGFKELKDKPSALHNTAFKKKMRGMMLKGQRPKECDYCWRVEDVGEYSDRIYKSSESWAKPLIEQVATSPAEADVNPTYLELAFDNICNFKCMYCAPAYSSSWLSEIKEHGPYPTSRHYNNLTLMKMNRVDPLKETNRTQYVEAFWKWWPSLSQSLQYLRVTGGEPLLTKDTWSLFESLASTPRPDLNFAVNSNMGSPEKLMDRLVQSINQLEGRIKSFTLYCSIDSVGGQAEYIRHGLSYALFMKNVERVLSETKWPISISYMITVNALALPGLKPLLQKILEQRQRFPQHHIGIDTPYLRNPEHLSVQILPKSFKRYIEDALIFMRTANLQKVSFYDTEIQRLERILELMESNELSWLRKIILRRDFFKMFQEHDRRRGTDFEATFPEYLKFWSTCRHLARLF